MTDTTKVQRIDRLERMKSSYYGNPRFRVYFTDGTSAPTQPDAMWAYGAENREYREGPVEVHYNGRGHITFVKILPVQYVATVNVPGYLPEDDDPPTFDTAREAWQYLVSEVNRAWDDYPDDSNGACVEAHTQLHNVDQSRPGCIYAPTPGYEGDHDLGLAYCVTVVEATTD